MAKPFASLALLFFLAHLPYLPPTLEDIDSVNFALGVRSFDVARHQPHPPGYPVFIALAKASVGALHAAGIEAATPRGLALLSVISGAILVVLVFLLFRALGADGRVAWWAMAVTVCSPLFWFTALRPLSDMTGLAFAVAAQLLLIQAMRGADEGRERPAPSSRSPRPETLLIAGAAVAGLAAGVRIQTAVLTGPLMFTALAWPDARLSWRSRGAALLGGLAGVLAWGVPLMVASGGLAAYLAALGAQAGEDFSGVVMLWTFRQARVAADALLYTFVWPWGSIAVGAAVTAAAAAGFLRAVWRDRATAALVVVAFGPYAVFHLLFHETVTIRYALPLVLPAALLAVYAMRGLGSLGLTIGSASLVVASLVITLPAARAYGRDGSPAFRLFHERFGHEAAATAGASGVADPVGMHAVMRRVEEWEDRDVSRAVLRAPHGREWLVLLQAWRRDPDVEVHFLADPRRTDLALLDPRARTVEASAGWTFAEVPFVAGTRPGAADAYRMRPPGWMLDRGWAVTAEVAGVTARDRLGPHVQPSVAWARTRPEAASLIIGGRHLGPEGAPRVRLTVSGRAGVLDSWEVPPGFFFRRVGLPAGSLAGTGYVPLQVRSASADGSGAGAPVSLEQFDLQSDGGVMLGLVDGWQEPEYDPRTARSWRWMSERARFWLTPISRDVTLTVSGESPLRYFDRAPDVRITAAGEEVARFTPGADFTQEVRVPARLLAASGGLLTMESELWFTPADRGTSADRRHLALRIYSIRAE